MTIDVYDNSCLASAVGVLGTVVPADYDEDCDTDLEDFAVIATAWLDGSELDDLVEMASKWLIEVEPLTEPVAKP